MKKFKFEVEIDLTDETQNLALTQFLKALRGETQNTQEATKQEVLEEEPEKIKPEKQEVKKKAVAKPKQKVEAETPEPELEGIEEEATGKKSNVDITHVRSAVAKKVGEHRDEIKNKMELLGASSVSTLDPKDYEGFLTFLNGL